jgi:murein DD-endopeptidase MepM/ murein hydrolase activator NlpD
VKRKLLIFCLALLFCACSARAENGDEIKWVDFHISAAAMRRAIELDREAQERDERADWISVLALAAVQNGGDHFTVSGVEKAAQELTGGKSPRELLGAQYKYYDYYLKAYTAALGGLVGSYAVELRDPGTGKKYWKAQYGVKAFSPIAAGWGYGHYRDFGASRSFGFARPHLGNDLLGALSTPIVAVESGTVEALGWNRYGGWRVGIRSFDRKRYYYYAHLQKDHPYAPGLRQGDRVAAGDVIGFMGRTGYSDKENVNNIDAVHLHFGLQLIFDESQKECDSEIWIDVYDIVDLLSAHRSSVAFDEKTGKWTRIYAFRDLDAPEEARS